MIEQIGSHLAILRRYGGRVTPVVRTTIDRLYASGGVRTAQQIRDQVSATLGYDIGNPTIYRILERLLQLGIVCSMHRPDGIMRYYLCRNPEHHHHHHFICSRCLSVHEVEGCMASALKSHIETQLKAKMQSHFIQIEGLCEQCLLVTSETETSR